MAKNTICLWYDKDAEAAARFYAETFPDSAVGAVHRAPDDYPSGTKGDVLTVEFTVAGVSCIGLNGGPLFKHNEAFSFQIATDDQDETEPEPVRAPLYQLRLLVPPGLLVFYVVAVDRLGFFLTAAGMVFTLCTLLGGRPRLAVPLALVAPIGLHLIFGKLLRVPLPDGPIPLPW